MAETLLEHNKEALVLFWLYGDAKPLEPGWPHTFLPLLANREYKFCTYVTLLLNVCLSGSSCCEKGELKTEKTARRFGLMSFVSTLIWDPVLDILL